MKNSMVKITSQRSGVIGWLRPDGTPSAFKSEAGLFTLEEAAAQCASFRDDLVKTVGVCRWTLDILSERL